MSTEEGAAARHLRKRVGKDFDGVDLAAALKQVARDAGVNLALDPRAEKGAATKVSLRLEGVPPEAAVRLLSEMAGLKPVRFGNVLFVTTKATAAQMRPDVPAPPADVSNRTGDISSFLAPPGPPPAIPPVPPPHVPPAVLPALGGDRN